MSQRALLLEAYHTTHIEGTQLTLDQAARLWAGDVRELLNYRDAFNLVAEYLGSGEPITEALIREIHQRLVRGVRERGMDLTGWVEYFVVGLATQMGEVKQRGEQVIRRDVIAREHGLNERQSLAMERLLQSGRMDIRDYERLCPGVRRRTLQRDLAALEALALIRREGETNRLVYLPGAGL